MISFNTFFLASGGTSWNIKLQHIKSKELFCKSISSAFDNIYSISVPSFQLLNFAIDIKYGLKSKPIIFFSPGINLFRYLVDIPIEHPISNILLKFELLL